VEGRRNLYEVIMMTTVTLLKIVSGCKASNSILIFDYMAVIEEC
jgi:hypothetical protein